MAGTALEHPHNRGRENHHHKEGPARNAPGPDEQVTEILRKKASTCGKRLEILRLIVVRKEKDVAHRSLAHGFADLPQGEEHDRREGDRTLNCRELHLTAVMPADANKKDAKRE